MKRNFEGPGRSTVYARHGMAATSHPAATLAAIEVLREGGNAMDAAVCACAVQGVVEPGSTGIGGDCFALYAPGGSSDVIAYNGAGRTPASADRAALAAAGLTEIPRDSPHAVTIPGAVDAWHRLVEDHGTLPLRRLLQPAADLARDGYAVAPRVAHDWQGQEMQLRRDEGAARALLVDGHAPAPGSVHRQPELAATLEAIGRHGRDGFYAGAVAEDIVETLRRRGGGHDLADFAAAGGAYVEPIRTTFHDHTILECPPPGQGLVALLILKILEAHGHEGHPLSPARLHAEVEAARLAYAVRDALLGDGQPASVDAVLSPAFVAGLAGRIEPDGPAATLPTFAGTPHRDTVYISVVDKDRNAASFINSIFMPFGSGIVAPRSGVLLHNRGQSFSLADGPPNAFGPRRQPMHTIIPGMVARGGRVVMPFGVMGGHYQAMGHAYFLSRVLGDGLDLQAAIDLPRLFPKPGTTEVEVEAGIPAEVRADLARRGFSISPAARPIGGAQAIFIDWEQGVLRGASDPRKDGCALGY